MARLVPFFALFFILYVISGLFSGSSSRTQVNNQYNVTVQNVTMAHEGLDLQAVGSLVKEAKDAQSFEALLNSKEKGLNNLDLNEDGNVDYISVSEYGEESSSARGFSLSVEVAKGDVQEIATIEVEKVSQTDANVEIRGNEQIYGHNHYHRSHFGFTDYLLLSYMFSPHPFYYSPYRYGYYPAGYGYRTAPRATYRKRAATAAKSSNLKPSKTSQNKSKLKSPNAGKTSKSIKTPLKNPTASQKSFQKRNPSKQVRSGGFGRSSQTKSRSQPSVRRTNRSGGFRRGK